MKLFVGTTAVLLATAMWNNLDLQVAGEPTYYEPMIVEATGYSNPAGNKTSAGEDTIEGVTISAKPEWEGCLIALYEKTQGGGIGDFIGYRQVTDTGYGHNSTLYPGRGTIETGETVDLFFQSTDDAIQWGSQEVYIQVIPGKG